MLFNSTHFVIFLLYLFYTLQSYLVFLNCKAILSISCSFQQQVVTILANMSVLDQCASEIIQGNGMYFN